MKRLLIIFFIFFNFSATQSQTSAQSLKNDNSDSPSISNEDLQLLFSPDLNHREIVLKSFELAVASGFVDTSGISTQEIKDRLEAGAYSEDFETIPGIVGDHFPAPWDLTPDFNFYGLYPFSKIPYGSYTDTLSGWYRGLNHGYDPVQGFRWPGANSTTVEWANYSGNSYVWNNAVELYRNGERAKAYQCLGHILHLLADLSIPLHIKVVDHGISVNSINGGTLINPDLLDLVVDEYELALAGGIQLLTLIHIPYLLDDFRSALDSSKVNNIPDLSGWADYLQELGEHTYNHPIVNQFYLAPATNGEWGAALNENGLEVNPTQYGITPPVQISGRWAQITLKSTANNNGTILPEDKMIEMCYDLVPKAVEYGAGLIIRFYQIVTNVESENSSLKNFHLLQNYPNPFNPSTKISYQLPVSSNVVITVYDMLGNEIVTLVDEYKPAGTYEVEWNATGLPSGIYFYQLKAEGFVETKKMILMK